MIKDKVVADEINQLMLRISAELDASLVKVQESCSEDEFIQYRGFVGNTLADILDQVMNPLYQVHPEMKPKELR